MSSDTRGRAPLSFARLILRMMGISWQAAPSSSLLYLVTLAVFTGLWLANVAFIQALVDRLPFLAQGKITYQGILSVVLLFAAATLLRGVMNGLMNFFYEYALKMTTGLMTERMQEKAGRIELLNFESAGLFNEIECAVGGRERAFQAMEKVVCTVLMHGGYFLVLGVYLAAVKWQLTLALAASFIPVALSNQVRASAWYQAMGRTSPLRREMKHYEECLTDRRYFKETRTLGARAFIRARYDGALEAYNREMWRTEARTGLADLGLKLLTLSGYLGVLALLLRYLFTGAISVGVFGAMYFTMSFIFKHFDEILERLGSALQDAAVAGLYFRFLDLPERTAGVAVVHHDRGVVLDAAAFRYPGEPRNAVDSVSLGIPPGATLAIVGENGAGKSTLVKLICGLLLPDTGSVFLDGVDTREAAPRALFDGTAAVFQDFQRYPMTLRRNVSISDPDSLPPDGRIREILAGVGAPESGIPAGLDAMLSPEFDGIDLSGGQWQRVAIARGLYRVHDLVVLDEPTSTIDPLEETELYQLFMRAAKGKTAILVTHRLGAARIADRIAVMDGGRIIEEGSHQALVGSGGKYARLWRAQAQWYERG
jgi:ATP-binding cassette, subfamily B, bacterial